MDAYYKDVRDLLDFGQFGEALIFTPINFRKGHVYGVEFSTTYRADPVPVRQPRPQPLGG